MITGIKVASLTALIYGAAVFFIFHRKKQGRVVHSLLIIGFSVLPFYPALFFFLRNGEETALSFLNGILIYGVLFYCLSHPFTVINTSLTLSILTLLEKAPGGRLSVKQVKEQYPYDFIVKFRYRQHFKWDKENRTKKTIQ